MILNGVVTFLLMGFIIFASIVDVFEDYHKLFLCKNRINQPIKYLLNSAYSNVRSNFLSFYLPYTIHCRN